MSYSIVDGYIVWTPDAGASTASITRSSDEAVTTPDGILNYATSGESRNVITDLIDGSIAVTLASPRPRSGTLNLFYLDRASAWAAYDLHVAADTFVLVDTALPEISMTYVVTGRTITLDPQSKLAWLVDVDYQEVEL